MRQGSQLCPSVVNRHNRHALEAMPHLVASTVQQRLRRQLLALCPVVHVSVPKTVEGLMGFLGKR